LDEALQEYLVNHDLQDAVLSVSELTTKSVANENACSAIVNRAVLTALDAKPTDFNLLITLLCSLHEKNFLPALALSSGYSLLLSSKTKTKNKKQPYDFK